jgi:uncharacterized protein
MAMNTGLLVALEVRSSTIHGRGVFAACDIPAGTPIGCYGGRRFQDEASHPGQTRSGITYLFALSDGSFIDGARGGNATRFINHSCTPNCAALEVDTDGRLSVVIESLHPIGRGQELLLDYALETPATDVELFACRCGTRSCRGTMVRTAC